MGEVCYVFLCIVPFCLPRAHSFWLSLQGRSRLVRDRFSQIFEPKTTLESGLFQNPRSMLLGQDFTRQAFVLHSPCFIEIFAGFTWHVPATAVSIPRDNNELATWRA